MIPIADTPTEPITDLVGQLVIKGDYIACAFDYGGTPEIRVGQVLGFSGTTEDATSCKILVEWLHDNRWFQSTKGMQSKIYASLGRFLVVTKQFPKCGAP